MVPVQEKIKLIQPTADLKASFMDMLDEHLLAGEDYFDHALAQVDFLAYLQKLEKELRGIDLTPEKVPMTTYWLVRDNQVVLGESRLRHFLTPALEHHGGHIGYVIRPAQRRMGYGTLLLKLTLEKARAMHLGLDIAGKKCIRITCDSENVGSVKVIEKNGGILAGQVISERSGKMISLYWVAL